MVVLNFVVGEILYFQNYLIEVVHLTKIVVGYIQLNQIIKNIPNFNFLAL